MEPERWHRIDELFGSALDLAPDERDAFLAGACDGDDDLRREVEALLGSRDRAGDFILTPAFEAGLALIRPPDEALDEGHRVGTYEVIREIGRGGMGAVYLAARADDEYRKRVAIKLIKRGLDTDDILRRFRNERQILASLDHPNIARLLDGGTTDDGLPYFVMEFIEGPPLTDYCDRAGLGVPERLELFRKICAAVQHAHQNLVVHRDLKPSNILVTAEGEPKLLDFGIAKLLEPEASPYAETATSGRIMTPAYASPEQVRGEPVTTASDVYSLGVLLYNLLTGRHPYRFDTSRPHDVERVICEERPERPSDAVTRDSPTAGTRPERLRRRLSGDLDNIALMAMRKEPTRRYASASELSEDIRRHLDGLPVLARKDTFGYRAGKFVSRHKVGVAAAALVAVTLVVAVAVTAWQARIARIERARAERRFNDVRRLANSFLFEFHDSIQDLAGSTPARELLVTRALEYLDSLAQESGDDPTLQRELATAYERVGDIQGNPYVPNLGDTDGALASYQKALTIREALGTTGTAAEAQKELALSHRAIGDILEQKGDVSGCVENYRRSAAIFERLATDAPSDVALRDEQARAYEVLGDGLSRTGDNGEPLADYRRSLAIREELVARDPSNAKFRRGVAVVLLKLGDAWTENADEGIGSLRKSVEILESLSAADPTNARARRDLSMARNRLGEVLISTGDPGGALDTLGRALALREEVSSKDPENVQARFDVATVRTNYAEALSGSGRTSEGLAAALEARDEFRSLIALDPENAVYVRNLGLCEIVVAASHARAGNRNEARAGYRRALDVFVDLRDRGVLRPTDESRIADLERLAATGEP